MTRPVGRVMGCSKCHGSGRVGSDRVGSGGVQTLAGRVRSGRFKRFSNLVSRVRRVESVSNIMGRFGSGPRFSKSPGVGPGRVKRRQTGYGPGQVSTRKKRFPRRPGQYDPRVIIC